MLNYYDPTDPTGIYYHLPDNPTKEELEKYQQLSLKMLVRSLFMFVILLVLLAIVSLFTSCASVQKTEHEQQTHVVTTDSAGTETSHAGQVTDQKVNVDSIITAILQRTREEFARQEQEHEVTTETLTETIDSLGRIVRQSQKTTDRTLSRQEQQRIERLEQTFEQQIHQAILSHDSLWNDRFSQYQASMTDSLSRIRDMQLQRTASNPITWWQNLQIVVGRLAMIAIAVLLALWLLRKKLPWIPFGK